MIVPLIIVIVVIVITPILFLFRYRKKNLTTKADTKHPVFADSPQQTSTIIDVHGSHVVHVGNLQQDRSI